MAQREANYGGTSRQCLQAGQIFSLNQTLTGSAAPSSAVGMVWFGPASGTTPARGGVDGPTQDRGPAAALV